MIIKENKNFRKMFIVADLVSLKVLSTSHFFTKIPAYKHMKLDLVDICSQLVNI